MRLIAYLVGINLLTYFLYWQDKRAAMRGGWRVSESALLTMGLAGGTLAALIAQQRLRHKTRKASFQLKFWATTALQIALLVMQPRPLFSLLSSWLG